MKAKGVGETGQAKRLVGPPDVLTALRIPLAVIFVASTEWVTRLGVVALAGASDVLDGIWARRIGGSRLGAVLDPVCDKVFVIAAFAAVAGSGLLSPLEIVGVLLRDLVAILAFAGVAARGRPTTLPPRAGGKAVTLCQMLTLVAFVAQSELLRPLAWSTAAISVYAIADYSRAAWRT